MKRLAMLLFLCLLTAVYAKAQHQMRDNTFGGIGAGLLSPLGDYKVNAKSGFQVNAEINGRIYRPLWFYVDVAYENLPLNSSVLVNSSAISTLGAGLGIKIFPVKFLYIRGGGGIRGVVSGTLPNSDNSTVYLNAGAGLYLLKFLNVFVDYNTWQAHTDTPANNYIVAGVKFSFGRK